MSASRSSTTLARLDALLFEPGPGRWFAIDKDNQAVPGVRPPSLAAGLALVGQGDVATIVGRVRLEVAVVDIDVEGDRGHAITEQLASWCAKAGLWHLVRPSGGPDGRHHVFVVHGGRLDELHAQVAQLRSRWRASAKAIDHRPSRDVRPLSPPHKLGGHTLPLGALVPQLGALLEILGGPPARVSKARRRADRRDAAAGGPVVSGGVSGGSGTRTVAGVTWSRGSALTPRRHCAPLPAPLAAYLRTGDGVVDCSCCSADTTSHLEDDVAWGLMRAGHDDSSAWAVIDGSHPDAMGKARGRGRAWWVEYVWNNAVARDRAWAAERSREALQAALTRFRAGEDLDDDAAKAVAIATAVCAAREALHQMAWALPRGERPAVLLVGHAVCDKAVRKRSLRVPVPERDLMLDTGIRDRKTIRRALRFLAGLTGVAAGPLGVLHTDTLDSRKRAGSSYEFEISAPSSTDRGVDGDRQEGVQLLPPPRSLTPQPGTWSTLPNSAHALWRTLTPEPQTLTDLATQAGLPTSRGDELTLGQTRSTRNWLEQLASAGLATCDAQGRWSAGTGQTSESAAAAAAAYAELVELVEAERAAYRSGAASDWSVARAAALKAQRAKEVAWWKGLPAAERARRRQEYAEKFATLSPVGQEELKGQWAARRRAAGIDEAAHHAAWLDGLTPAEALRRASEREIAFQMLDPKDQAAKVAAWKRHRERFGVPVGTPTFTNLIQQSQTMPDTRDERDAKHLAETAAPWSIESTAPPPPWATQLELTVS